jgi:hypothetical protein
MTRAHFFAWFGLLVIAFANGAFREFALARWLSRGLAGHLSTILLILVFGVFIFFVMRRWRPASGLDAITIGLVWMLMTVVFESLLGRYGSGQSWREVFAAYDLRSGNLWAMVPLWVGVAPYLMYRTL